MPILPTPQQKLLAPILILFTLVLAGCKRDQSGDLYGPPIWILHGQVCFNSEPTILPIAPNTEILLFKEGITFRISKTYIATQIRPVWPVAITALLVTSALCGLPSKSKQTTPPIMNPFSWRIFVSRRTDG
jgi:hypothetical protein